MSEPSTQHLRDLVPSEERESIAKECIGRIITYGLPMPYRKEFFPDAVIYSDEQSILDEAPYFVEAAAVHLVVQRLGQHPKIKPSVKAKMNLTKAALFFDVCVSRSPPPKPKADPVVEYGWDRHDDRLRTLQNECAEVLLRCDRLGYVGATPTIKKYLASNPDEWYARLAKHLTSAGYKNDFAAKMMGGKVQIQSVLLDLFIKLTLLRDAAREDLKPEPQSVIAQLCEKVGIPALDMADLDDATKEQIRHLLEDIQELEKTHDGFSFHFILYGMLDVSLVMRLPEILDKVMNSGNWVDRLLKGIAFGFTEKAFEWLLKTVAENELNRRIENFLSGPGRQYGLLKDE